VREKELSDVKRVYAFGGGRTEGNKDLKFILGGKGANLAEMANMGLPVPPGFTITCQACMEYYNSTPPAFPAGLSQEIAANIAELEGKMGKTLGDPNDPLLVSVRSGSPFSMPGMMDTVLNLGLNDVSVQGLIAKSGNERFAWDSYRRFIQMFSKVVLDAEGDLFENAITKIKLDRGVKDDTELSAEDMRNMVDVFKAVVAEHVSADAFPALAVDGKVAFPQDATLQLQLAIEAVFRSWMNDRAVLYRKMERIADDLGTAVNVQSMVFGNMGETSGTGVGFTRNAADGTKEFYGDFLTNAQGEDVVAGIRTTRPIAELPEVLPEAGNELWNPAQLDQLLHPQFDAKANYDVVAKGLNASPGAAVGEVVFSADYAEEAAAEGRKVILVRWETTPDDLHGMIAAQGILTSHGGKTSHAAVVARGMGKPCVCGAEKLRIDAVAKVAKIEGSDVELREGDIISIDGTTGIVVLGAVSLVEPEVSGDFDTILSWADEYRTMGVRANADTPDDAALGRKFGAAGIGLCRTEHMFLGERKDIIQRFVLADDETTRLSALDELLEAQVGDYLGIFEAMDGLPVTVRLLDPPLHEFLDSPRELEIEIVKAECAGASAEELAPKRRLLAQIDAMAEMNPMLGLRGCRLGIMHPELYAMQVRAITLAACQLKKAGGDPRPEIMIPLVSLEAELQMLRDESERVVAAVKAECGIEIDIPIGTMIELPRAAIMAEDIGKVADFFSFGTNDLTQTTFGFSRDDIESKFLPRYLERKVMARNPFETVDEGVAKMVELGCKGGRAANPKIKLGVCGEHGGDPESVKTFYGIGLDYVSCSPYRIPLARLAAAQAKLADSAVKSDNR